MQMKKEKIQPVGIENNDANSVEDSSGRSGGSRKPVVARTGMKTDKHCIQTPHRQTLVYLGLPSVYPGRCPGSDKIVASEQGRRNCGGPGFVTFGQNRAHPPEIGSDKNGLIGQNWDLASQGIRRGPGVPLSTSGYLRWTAFGYLHLPRSLLSLDKSEESRRRTSQLLGQRVRNHGIAKHGVKSAVKSNSSGPSASEPSKYLKIPAAGYINELGIEGRLLAVHRSKEIALVIDNSAQARMVSIQYCTTTWDDQI
ncbi:hypothetical protein B0H10DRAFT_1956897 [Mycena sp. CBHHK59/15]|nr:hypothetical protein B0H10DRAFT_1956897 [Mycena sp. CBHHK59/15]